MEKGIFKLKPKPRHIVDANGKTIPIKKEVPEIGKEYDKLECQFEGSPITKIIFGAVVFAIDLEKKAEQDAQKEAQRIVQEEADKQAKLMENRENTTTANDSLNIAKTHLPKDVRSIAIADIDNFSLKLNKAARFETVKDKNKFHFYSAKPQEEKDRSTGKKTVLLEAFQIKPNFGNLDFAKIAARQTQNAINWLSEGNTHKQTFTPDWRVIVGLGGASVYETSMTLHHIYGVPYIPASSIKGVLRSHIIAACFDNDEKEALKNEAFCRIFGCPAKSALKHDGKAVAYEGNIIFFDAFPTKKPTIVPDIMNPHYSPYYSDSTNKTAPADYHSPIPVFFLTVADTPFEFVIGTQNSSKLELNTTYDFNRGSDAKTIADWLKHALQNHGIGAKTAVGYGYMQ